ncbi:MAG TPA: helix-turn-helix transcriptional regulator [Herpetosiphonaceae bacterium]
MSDVLNVQALRSLREARGWDQLTLARAAGVDPSVISRLERGIQVDLRASVLVALARALQTSVDSLVVPPQDQPPSATVLELSVVYAELAQLPSVQQRQVAAILRAYLSTVAETDRET